MRAVEVKRAAADDVRRFFEHDEVAHVFADLGEGAGKQRAVSGVG